MSVYTVLLRDLDSLSKKINHITKKCDKAGIGYTYSVGEPYENVILLKTICYESCYGTGYFHLFTDDNGNVFKWSTNKALLTDDYHSIDEGTRLSLTGTVKSHDEYRGVKQTVITRCKYSVIQDNEPEEYPEGTWDDSVLDCICV